ncbi:sigma factor-like helix-turn-helix DNA-binding protein, partial [Burkholderia sp. SIMBA_043]|uniref:helix-turn-helix transcriptional regulator n=1 Tax=Burkholderia sp. SIMBA_043 TaxID=3085784 RepID=UPI00397AF7B1
KEKKRNILIDQKNIETHNLRKKLDNSFEELIQLAIHDDPLFIPKFKEIYFEFYTILISGYPQLTASDIKFCAFIKLNFSNKEIAEYGHMSIRTVESKTYRIRKKIELDQEIDFNNWI